MTGYKIALIVEEIDQSYQSAILNGIASSAAEFSLNISAFVSFSGEMNNSKHDAGEFNIFNLPDLRNFDGAILLTNTLAYQPVITDILNRIKEAGIPAVSIDNDIPYLYHIGIDNRTAMRNITEHLIKVHGFSKFCYISGPADNPESADRLKAFRSVLWENDIRISDKNIFFGDFRAHSGRNAIEYFLNSGEDMPEAIICANDVMAASAINRLADEGFSVPKDIAVTGFDNTYNTHNYQIELTTVDRPLSLSGRLACKMLYNHFMHNPQERNVILSMSTIFTESCGCSDNVIYNLAEYRGLNYKNYIKFENSQKYMSSLNRISSDLQGSNNFTEYIECLKNCVKMFSPDEFYFCLCDNWDSEYSLNIDPSQPSDEEKIPTEYTDEMYVPIAYKDGKFYETDKISRKDIMPDIAKSEICGKFYYHIPLHFGERCLGYMVILYRTGTLNTSIFETFCINISNSLENVRKRVCLENVVSRLEKLYTRDTFTDIYNRNGFVQATRSVYHSCVANQRDIMLMFIDLDGLKKINDTYGHNIGDKAIHDIAHILKESCGNHEIYCRFGGDEFIVFAADYSDADARELCARINGNIDRINEKEQNPFRLSASIGYVIAKPREGEDIFRFVTAADKIMYTEKRKKKLSKYLKG